MMTAAPLKRGFCMHVAMCIRYSLWIVKPPADAALEHGAYPMRGDTDHLSQACAVLKSSAQPRTSYVAFAW